MKSKLLKPLIITGGVLAVLIGAYLLFDYLNAQDVVQSPEPSSNSIFVLNSDGVDIERMSVAVTGAPSFEITKTTKDSIATYTVLPSIDGFTYNTTSVATMMNYMKTMLAKMVIKEDAAAEDLSTYGFDSPTAVITARYKDGSDVTLTIGGATISDDGYYAMSSESNTIYLLYQSSALSLLTPETQLRVITLFPAVTDEGDVTADISNILFTRPDESYINLRRRADEEFEKLGAGASNFEMSLPALYNTNDTVFSQNFVTPLLAVTADDIVEDYPADLSKYGLDKPYSIELTDLDGEVYKLLVGNETEDGARYIMVPGVDCVMSSDADFSFLSMTKEDIISSFVWIYDIDEITRLEYNMKGEEYTLALDSDKEADTFKASLNGGEITDINARRLYMRTISIFVEGEIPEGATLGNAEYKIVMSFRDGTSRTLELRPINPRQYAIVLDGEYEFYTAIKDIEYLMAGFEANARGEEIPSI